LNTGAKSELSLLQQYAKSKLKLNFKSRRPILKANSKKVEHELSKKENCLGSHVL